MQAGDETPGGSAGSCTAEQVADVFGTRTIDARGWKLAPAEDRLILCCFPPVFWTRTAYVPPSRHASRIDS